MSPLLYSGYRFPRDIIQRAVWMYLRFTLSFRDIEKLLAERGITVTYESVHRWVLTFGPAIGRGLRARPQAAHSVAPRRGVRADRRPTDVPVAGR